MSSASSQSAPSTHTRKFIVSPAIIRNLIERQAGTLEKALMENVMNAIDAGATRVHVTLDRHGYTVDDDGRGFESNDQIEQYFETFGFEHEGDALQAGRTYGTFGIGRGQQWHWASTVYRSRHFSMAVDIRARGLDYLLEEVQWPVAPVISEGSVNGDVSLWYVRELLCPTLTPGQVVILDNRSAHHRGAYSHALPPVLQPGFQLD
ncbi:hypothetical protein GCM10008957_27890 [Deinococcus ruber]|uniref:Uncharacterized protein n=1 Tax=Deinococcus ruber TaxID=1848197 RepID=A0A918CA11_9DEIO|nr:ATP-binding protein [Deinococcus ruber]GGR13354.1 hypothetical protein GCM10008957_27890 [Deinococcus ruber]